jgi:hypothetical protein
MYLQWFGYKVRCLLKSIVELEQAFPFSNQTLLVVGELHYDSGFQPANIFGSAGTLYFVLAATIDDRLFKIRHLQGNQI